MEIISGTGSPEEVLVRIQGDEVNLGNNGVFIGTYVAPNADLHLDNNISLEGAAYGERVDLNNNAGVAGAPATDLFSSLFLP